jgi:hypothetical protein
MLAKRRIAGLPEKPSMKPGHRVLLLALLAALVAPACRETSGPELRSGYFAVPEACGCAVKWNLDFDRIESDLAVDADRIVYVIARTTAQSLYKLYGLRDGAVVSSEPTRWVRRMSYHPLLIHPGGRLYYVTDGEVVFAPTAGVHPSAPWPMPGADAQRSRRR